MEKQLHSKFIFNHYIVNSIDFKINEDYKFKKKKIEINYSINIKVESIENNDAREGRITLTLNVFEKAKEKGYPFELCVSITGLFSGENFDKEEFDNFCKVNGTTALYPFLRSTVADITKAANVQPLLLPLINIQSLIVQEEEKLKNKSEEI